MSFARPGVAGHRRTPVTAVAILLMLAVLVAVPTVNPTPSLADAAASSSLAVVVVGPVGAKTAEYEREARRIATQLRSNGARVREVYSPNATWSRVARESHGANLFIYLGQGRGIPGSHSALAPRSMNGLGLNRAPANGHWNERLYGEYYLRGLRLAPGAVVILDRVPYASGNSEPGRTIPTRVTAAKRADNYAAGFLDAGAAAVFASDRSVSSIVRDLFGAQRTMRSIFWRSPWTTTAYDFTFASSRTPGAGGILAPYSPNRYYQSVVGRLGWTTADWQRTWGSASIASSSIRVTSIPALLTALANDAVTEIVVANGTYRVSGAADKATNSLWIGAKYATRTSPVLVRAETTGGVTFTSDGSYFGGISFQEGAHDQTWQGFHFAYGAPMESGVIMFGGYAGSPGAHHITLRDITVDHVGNPADPHGHVIYFSYSVGGAHDILIDGLNVDDSLGGIKAALHFYHSDAANRNAWNVTVRNMHVIGTRLFAIVVWDPTAQVVVEDSTITGALGWAVRFEEPGQLTLRRVTSTGSVSGGFYSSLGANPPAVTFDNVSLR